MHANSELINDFICTTFEIRRLMQHHESQCTSVNAHSKLQFFALKTIESNKDITVGELADDLMLTSGAVSQLLERLLAKKWITKEVDSKDGRKYNLEISILGKKQAIKMHDLYIERASKMLNYISEKDLKILINIQSKLIKKLKDEKNTSVS